MSEKLQATAQVFSMLWMKLELTSNPIINKCFSIGLKMMQTCTMTQVYKPPNFYPS